jgi:hypothetical protein
MAATFSAAEVVAIVLRVRRVSPSTAHKLTTPLLCQQFLSSLSFSRMERKSC